jgi:Tfp pilus assembly protein PilW
LKPSANRNGFTLVELALASAIAVVIMCGVLSVFASIARDRSRLAALNGSIGADRAQIVQVISKDLAGASFFSGAAGQSINFQTDHSLDSNLRPIDRPSVVSYSVTDSNGTHCLVRRQQFLDDLVSPQAVTNLVAFGVQKIDVNEIHSSVLASPTASTKLVPITCRRVHLEVDFDDPASKIDQIVCLP